MTRGEVETTVRSIFEIVLKRPIDLSENVSKENEGAWDSVNNVELLFMLEEAFELELDEDEVSDLHTFNEIVDRLVARTTELDRRQ